MHVAGFGRVFAAIFAQGRCRRQNRQPGWISSLSVYVYHLVHWPFEKRDEEGRLPKIGKYVLETLVYPLNIRTAPVGCVGLGQKSCASH